MEKSKWIWMPHPGHFICSRDCKFFLNTYVGKYIVSTVGELWSDQAVRRIHAEIHDLKWYMNNRDLRGDNFDIAYMNKFGYQDIGMDRQYETMVFKAKKSLRKCCPWQMSGSKQMDMNGYKAADEAYAGHMKLCKKWSKK